MAARSQLPSEISHVIFRREDGWTPSKAARWLEVRGVSKRSTDYFDEMDSAGGKRLKAGSYLVFRIVPKTRGFTSFGYSDEVSPGGVWFKFGGYRPRSKSKRRSKDHLGASGTYYVEYEKPNGSVVRAPAISERDAFGMVDTLVDKGYEVLRVIEKDDLGRIVEVD